MLSLSVYFEKQKGDTVQFLIQNDGNRRDYGDIRIRDSNIPSCGDDRESKHRLRWN